MEKRMDVSFPGNQRVDCAWGAHIVRTDQTRRVGGDESAPTPFDLFFASIATCAGISALDYLRKNNLPVEGLRVTLIATFNPDSRRYDQVRVEITPPPGLSPTERDFLEKEASDCTVKRHILNPPVFETVLRPE